MKSMYSGVVVPMVTPFNEDFTVDRDAVKKIVNSFVDAGVNPFVLGTTGEYVSLSMSQKEILVEETVKAAAGKVKVYAGISSDCFDDSVYMAEKFSKSGADVLVTILPYYYPLRDEVLIRYGKELADKCPKPLMIYNMPLTTNVSVPLEVVDELSHHPNIVGTKDSENNKGRLLKSLRMWKDRDDFYHLTGCAALSSLALKNGSDGIVPSVANFAPEYYKNLYNAALEKDFAKVERYQQITNDLSILVQKDRILSENLAALKCVMSVCGFCTNQMMMPLYKEDRKEYKDLVKSVLEKYNISYEK